MSTPPTEDTQGPPTTHPAPGRPVTGPTHRGAVPLLRRLHFYAGVLVAPFILVAAVTGGLYALAPTVERVVYRDLLVVEPVGDPLPLTAQAAAARAAHPDLAMAGARPAAGPEDSTRVLFTDPALGEDVQRAVFVDPYTGRVLGDEPTWLGYLPVSTWLDGLHRHLNLGEPGRVYSELAASWLWVVALGGLALWWPRRRSDRRRGRPGRLLTVDRAGHGRSRTLNWHGAVGVWILPMLLFLSATGITWSTYAGATVSELRAHFAWERPALTTTPTGPAPDGGGRPGHEAHGQQAGHGRQAGHDGGAPAEDGVDLDRVVAAAAAAGVAAPLEVTLPTQPGHAVGVTETDAPYRLTTDAAAIDPVTGAVTSVVDYDRDYSTVAKLADWGIRMHMGFLFGWLNQLLLFAVAAALVTVVVRGYRMWWQRRPTRGSAWAVGRPPLRGVLRRTRPAVTAVVVLAALAVGWFLPVLGVSLVAFVVVDVALGRVAALRTR